MELVLNLKDLSKHIYIKKVARGLGDMIRLSILKLIHDDNTDNLNYGEIAKQVKRSPTSITNHMYWLRDSGIIEDLIIEGKRGKMQKIPKLKFNKIIINLD